MTEDSNRKGYKELPPETREWIEQSEKAYTEDLAKLRVKRQIRAILDGPTPGMADSILETLYEERK